MRSRADRGHRFGRPGGRGYGARLVVIDLASGLDRTILESDIQLGWVTGSVDGTRLAVVEALCSDRLVVAGELPPVDPVDGDVVRVETSHVDVAGLAWRDQERLLAIGVRDLDSVVLDVDAKTGTATERWATEDACGVLFIAAAPVDDDFALVLQSATRPPELVIVAEDGTPNTVVHTHWRDGPDPLEHRVADPRVVGGAGRIADQRAPDRARRRAAVPADPGGPRRTGVGVSGLRPVPFGGVTCHARVRDPYGEPARLMGSRPRLRGAGRG